MKLIECARAAGVTPDAVRHYLRTGLLSAVGRTESGYRTFSAASVARVRFIRSAVGLGFTLKDVKELIAMSDRGDLPCPRARLLLHEHLAEHRARLDDMVALYERMKHALRGWRELPDGVPDGTSVCGLIEGSVQRLATTSKKHRSARRKL